MGRSRPTASLLEKKDGLWAAQAIRPSVDARHHRLCGPSVNHAIIQELTDKGSRSKDLVS